MQSTTTSTRTFMPSPPDKDKKKPKAAKPKRSFKLPVKFSPWLLVLALVLFSIFMFVQYREAQRKLETNPANTSKQVSSVVERVGKLIILPKDETPTIVTVKDASKLKAETFYKDARNGDITLVYSQQKKAILYRPSANIIVNVANVTVTSTDQAN